MCNVQCIVSCTLYSLHTDLEKTNSMNSAEFNKKKHAKFVQFSAKYESLNVQIRNNVKNILFIACKLSKICKYYVNSMVISCSTCQRKKKNAHGLNI